MKCKLKTLLSKMIHLIAVVYGLSYGTIVNTTTNEKVAEHCSVNERGAE
jgi:hypothetical protein